MNDQAEAMNKFIVAELIKRLSEARGAWIDELPGVLCAYWCTSHETIGESPFNLIYDKDAMLLIEVGEPTLRRQLQNLNVKTREIRHELDLVTERREKGNHPSRN